MKLALVIVIALIVGGSAGWFLKTPGARAAESGANLPAAPRPHTGERELLENESAGVRPDERREIQRGAGQTARAAAGEGLISGALREYADAEMRAGWAERRHDPLPDPLLETGFAQFEEVVKRTPREIGRRLAGEQTDREALAGTDGLAILRALDSSDLGPQLGLVQDKQRFPTLFGCSGGTVLDGVAAQRDLEHTLQEGVTLAFGPGVYSLEALTRASQELPGCLGVAGAGMDSTLLVARGWIPRGRLDRLCLRDCTLLLQGLDLRSAAGLLRAERVRFADFDTGAGSSSLFDANHGLALWLSDCSIEGGFGHSPDSGNLFGVRSSALLARFERCRLSRLHFQMDWWHGGSTVVFSHCTLSDLLDREAPAARDGIELVFENSSVELRRAEDGSRAARDLNELFPEWSARLGR